MARDPKKDDDGKKRFSVLGLLFNPRLGQSTANISETWAIFVRTIALLFVSVRLINSDDPIVQDVAGKKPDFFVLIQKAWDNLVFDTKHILQIGIFFGLIGGIAFVVLGALSILISLFHAHPHPPVQPG